MHNSEDGWSRATPSIRITWHRSSIYNDLSLFHIQNELSPTSSDCEMRMEWSTSLQKYVVGVCQRSDLRWKNANVILKFVEDNPIHITHMVNVMHRHDETGSSKQRCGEPMSAHSFFIYWYTHLLVVVAYIIHPTLSRFERMKYK